MAADSGLFETVVKLVNLGFAGVGVVVLLLLFIILIRDQPANAATQKLRNRFLTWGMSFAFFCGVLAVVGPWLAPRAVVSEPPSMLLNFSPSFTTEGLPAPKITLPDGETVDPGKKFIARGGQVLVSVDDALKDVATLKETAVTLAETASAAQKQADQAVAALTKAQGPTAPPVAAAQTEAKNASAQTQVATVQITEAIKAGNFTVLEDKRQALNTRTIASVRARDRVIRQAAIRPVTGQPGR